MGLISNLWVKLGLDKKGFEKGVNDAEKQTKSFSNTVKKVGGVIAGAFAVGAIVSWGKAAANTVVTFEKETSRLAATLGKTTGEISALTQLSLDLGRTTRYTATQVTQLSTELGKLGFNTREIQDASAATLDLATATGAELSDAARIAGSALRAFNLEADEMNRVASVLAVSTTKSALSIGHFETALSSAAPVAATFGFEIEDVVALIGKLVDAGFDNARRRLEIRSSPLYARVHVIRGDLACEHRIGYRKIITVAARFVCRARRETTLADDGR